MKTENSLTELVLKRFRQYADTRRNSVETKWRRNSEAYRFDKSGEWRSTWKEDEGKGWRSDTFVNITHQKCLAAHALIADLIMENGKIPFELDCGNEKIQEQYQEPLKAIHDEMEMIIRDVNVDRQLNKNLLSLAVFGETYAKFGVKPMPRVQEVLGEDGEPTVAMVEAMVPDWIFVPVWDLFFDAAFDTLSESPSVIHRMYLSKSDLKSKIGRPFFLEDGITSFISERSEEDYARGRGDADESPRFKEITKGGAFPVYEFWGLIPKSDAESFEALIDYKPDPSLVEADDGVEHADGESSQDVYVMLWFSESRILRYTRVSRQDFPFVRCHFEETLDSNWGVGVADNVEDVQKVLNGTVRAFEDNKKLSGNVMLATKDRFFETGDTAMSPGKIFHLTEDCQDARQAIQPIIIPDVGAGLMDIITLFNDRFADEFSQLPKVTQGIHAQRNITAFEISQQVENAGKYIGAVVRNIDEFLLEPILQKFYEMVVDGMELGVPPEIFQVKTMGYKTFQNKITRIQKLQQLLQMAAEPSIGQYIKMKELIRNITQAYDIDPDKFIKTDEELEAEAEAQAEQQEFEMRMAQLTMDKAEAEVALLNARAADSEANAQSKGGKLDIDRARLVSDIEQRKTAEAMQFPGM